MMCVCVFVYVCTGLCVYACTRVHVYVCIMYVCTCALACESERVKIIKKNAN